MFSEESVLWPLGVVIIVACDGNLFTVTPIVLGCDAVLAGGDCGANGCEFPACPRLSFETGHFFCKLQVCGKKSGYYSGNLRYEKAAAK